MRIGLFFATTNPYATPEFLAAAAAGAEEGGFSAVWVGEHAVLVDEYESRYPYNETGTLALGRNPGVFDPFPALTVAAMATTTLEVGTSILLIGERPDAVVRAIEEFL